MVYVLLGNGFEEIEAISIIDILRRGGVETETVSVCDRTVSGAHGIPVLADRLIGEVRAEAAEMVVLPGGMGGVRAIERCAAALSLIRAVWDAAGWVAAICAGPTALAQLGITDGKKVICYPGLEDQMGSARVQRGEKTVTDGRLITGEAPGAAMAFGLRLVKTIQGEAEAHRVAASMVL
ncbi:MAG: DJ-1 family glyoxalase III [Oscillospiraceae bacterium]|nr:DJ-1 family glyoxalase III [Oscillospiraceae bacterium]